MDFIIVGRQLVMIAGLEEASANLLGGHDLPCIEEPLILMTFAVRHRLALSIESTETKEL